MNVARIAIFASGTGSNALNLIYHFDKNDAIEVALLLSNKADALVVDLARNEGIRTEVLPNSAFVDGQEVLDLLHSLDIQWIILAGFLRKVPSNVIRAFDKKIINIHPSLLPNFGGSGMYGMYVHQAVIDAKASESGITIHYVNEVFDEGEHIAQFVTTVTPEDTPETLAIKIQHLEHDHFPAIIAATIQS